MEDIVIKLKEHSSKILEALGFSGEPLVKQKEGVFIINIQTDEAPLLIGKRGENLQALEHLIRLLIGPDIDGYIKISVDVAGYREKNAEKVRRKAKDKAYVVVNTGIEEELPPMSAYERRIVHITCQNIADVETESIGYGRERRVKIKPKTG